MSVSIENTDLTYVSVYDGDTGERITSYVTGVHGDTIGELMELAIHSYPDAQHMEQDAALYINALNHDWLCVNGEYQERPDPTEDEKRAAELTALDNEYSAKISEIELEMAKAKAVEDEDYYSDLKEEREELVEEYETKREEI